MFWRREKTTRDLVDARRAMVESQIAGRGVRDARVLEAMLTVPREVFVPEELAPHAYDDSALPIDEGQTISQPYVVALMTAALEATPDDRVLEIGTGSGYGAAVLSRIAREVYTVERHPRLAGQARERWEKLGYGNVRVRCGDGTLGWPEHAPYDGIVVTAAAPAVPSSLKSQLTIGGRLVIPVGVADHYQTLVRLTLRPGDGYEREELGPVRFVPLIGAEGWNGEGHGGARVPPHGSGAA